jgi:hypothetical protein
LQVLWGLTLIFSAIVISKLMIKRSAARPDDNKKTASFLAALSGVLFIFIFTVLRVWQSTTFNNNNYALNNAAALIINIVIPAWLVATTVAFTYAFSSRRKKHT